jgi:perosamine synthetase
MPLIPRFKPNYNWKEWFAAFSFWRNDLNLYENEFAQKFGCLHGLMFSYGRSALYALFKVWNIVDKEIITPAYTCVVVPHAIVLSGNQPKFVDCEKGSFNMDYDQLESSITARTGAIVVTHLFGYAMDVKRIDDMVKSAEKKFSTKIYVIQDLAHSYGTSFQGEMVSQYGDASIFGCNISKIINSIFGGMVITNESSTHLLLKKFREQNTQKAPWTKELKRLIYMMATSFAFQPIFYGLVNYLERRNFLDRFTKYYNDDTIEFPVDWNELPKKIEARVGRIQLMKYDKIIENRRKCAKKTIEYFKDNSDIKFLEYDHECTYSHIVALVENRDEWIVAYRKKRKQLGTIIDYSVPEMKSYTHYKKNLDDFPVAKKYSKHIINFPIVF